MGTGRSPDADAVQTAAAWRGLPVNAVFLILFGCFALIYGVLLIPIQAGLLPYDNEAATAVFVVVFAIMTGFLGLTPVGTFEQSRLMFGIGVALVLLGATAFISPGSFGHLTEYLLAAMLAGLGLIRLPIFLWRRHRDGPQASRDYERLYISMHLLCLALAASLLFSRTGWLSALLLLALGCCQLGLGFLAVRPDARVPGAAPVGTATTDRPPLGRLRLSMRSRLMLLLAVAMLFMVVMAVLGVLRIFRFDPTRMSILFVLITSMQVILIGETPVHGFRPSWPLAALGMLIAAAALTASIVPGLIDGYLGTFVGLCNLLTAGFGFANLVTIVRGSGSLPPGHQRRAMWRAVIVSALVFVLLVIFALNLLLPGAVPSLAMLAVLLATGVLLAWLAVLLDRLPE